MKPAGQTIPSSSSPQSQSGRRKEPRAAWKRLWTAAFRQFPSLNLKKESVNRETHETHEKNSGWPAHRRTDPVPIRLAAMIRSFSRLLCRQRDKLSQAAQILWPQKNASRRSRNPRSADILVGLPAPPRQAGFGVGARFGPTRMSALLRLARKSSRRARIRTDCSARNI